MKKLATAALGALIALSGCAEPTPPPPIPQRTQKGPPKPQLAPEQPTAAVAAGPAEAPAAPADAPAAPAGPPGDPKQGEAIYKRICIACHQPDGTGLGGMLGADFVNDKTRLAKTDAQLLKSIAEGVTGGKVIMPPQKGALSDQEMRDALAYVRATFGKR